STAFRLLFLLPSRDFDDTLECRLEIASFDDAPHYIALSYCWGNMSDNEIVLINGTAHNVTLNLATALRHLRAQSRGRPRTIWVDQICINHKDLLEKSRQISIMRSMFSEASKVVAWLGASTESSEYAMNRL
ncbi:heterokaryon incompatibility protein-domain-containing protein, partial [Leptodontidium sp. 2 PMI_412]